MMENCRDNFRELLRAASEMPVAGGVGVGDVGFGFEAGVGGGDLERRVMMAVVRREVERSRRRARRGMIASLSGLAMLFAGCIAAVVAWFPALLPSFSRLSWLEWVREIPLPEFLDSADFVGSVGSGFSVSAGFEGAPLFEQWGGLVVILLLVGGAVGFVYYLNSLFSNDNVRG
jgi:hypothetical protein